jgi:hypothetical protein
MRSAGVANCSGIPVTCLPVWSAPTGSDYSTAPPAVADGVLYVGSSDATLRVFGLP